MYSHLTHNAIGRQGPERSPCLLQSVRLADCTRSTRALRMQSRARPNAPDGLSGIYLRALTLGKT